MANMTESGCTCDLHEVTTAEQFAHGESTFVRGQPNGCLIHETPDQREQRLVREHEAANADKRRVEAMRAARTSS